MVADALRSECRGLNVDSGANLIVVGYLYGNPPQENSYTFVIKYDETLNVIWEVVSSGNGGGQPWAVTVGPTNEIIVGGRFWGTLTLGDHSVTAHPFTYNSFVAKISADGATEWLRAGGSTQPESHDEGATALAVDDSGSVYVAGQYRRTATFDGHTVPIIGGRDLYVIKYSHEGVIQWLDHFGSTGYDWASDIMVRSDGSITVTGLSLGAMFLRHISDHGRKLCHGVADGSSSGSVLLANEDGVTYLVGRVMDAAFQFGSTTIPYSSASFVAPIDGCAIASQPLIVTAPQVSVFGGSASTTHDGDFIIAAHFGGAIVLDPDSSSPITLSAPGGAVRAFVARVLPAHVSTEPPIRTESEAPFTVFPNPTGYLTKVRLCVPFDQPARVEIIDLLGRRVSVVLDEPLEAGTHTRTFDASALPSGVYLVRLTAGGRSETRKVVVAR
jgi:hypothetical protein